MAWKVELAEAAAREIDKLDPQVARRILKFLRERVAKLEDPRSIAERCTARSSESFGNTALGTTVSSASSKTNGWLSLYCAWETGARSIAFRDRAPAVIASPSDGRVAHPFCIKAFSGALPLRRDFRRRVGFLTSFHVPHNSQMVLRWLVPGCFGIALRAALKRAARTAPPSGFAGRVWHPNDLFKTKPEGCPWTLCKDVMGLNTSLEWGTRMSPEKAGYPQASSKVAHPSTKISSNFATGVRLGSSTKCG